MKTDRFSDIIRRKLESIRPEFTEKDWVRMQATLHQAGMPQPGHAPTGHPFSGGVWSGGQSWLLAAASVSTAALIGVSIWQHNQISNLRETVAQLKQKATVTQATPVPSSTESPMVAQSSRQPVPGQPTEQLSVSTDRSQNERTIPRRDTVYIDRYTMTPASPYLEKRLPRTEREEPAQPQSSQSVTKNYAATDRYSIPMGSSRRRNELTVSPKTNSYGINSTPLTSNQSTSTESNQSVSADQPDYQLSQPERIKTKSTRTRSEQYATVTQPTHPGRLESSQSVNESPASTQATAQSNSVDQPETNATVSASYESIASRPLTPQTVNWNALLAQQAKRMRPAKVAVNPPAIARVETKAPVSKPEKRIEHMGVRFRAGIGGEIASHLLGGGVYTETLLGKHWLVGVGINQTTFNGRFVNDDDFYVHTHRNLRSDLDLKVDPKGTILNIDNIDTQTTRLQVPLYLGYRIPLTASIAFLPTAGTYLNLTNTENITYYIQTINDPGPFPIARPRIISQKGEINNSRPVELINSLAFSTGVEWQQKHWVLQGSPVLTVPLQANMGPMQSESNWQQNITLGFRARLLYQF